jgi:tetrahydromethanopterin S-methyltransferase subunit G
MAGSKLIMARVKRLEMAFVQITQLLVDHGERFDRIDKRLEGIDRRFDGVDKRLDGVTERLDGVTERLDGVTERLDRLISVTIEERTRHYDRLQDIEQRLTKLEELVGV